MPKGKKRPFNVVADERRLKNMLAKKKQSYLLESLMAAAANAPTPAKKNPLNIVPEKKKNKMSPEAIAKRTAAVKERRADPVAYMSRNIIKKSKPRRRKIARLKAKKERLAKRPDLFKNFAEFTKVFHNEKTCMDLFTKMRVKLNGMPNCPKCETATEVRKVNATDREAYQCLACGGQFGLSTDTMYHKSKLTMQQYFNLLYWECRTKNVLTFEEAADHVGISLKTAYAACNKLRATAFNQDIFKIPSHSKVVVDTLAVGGINAFRPDHKKLTKQECHAAKLDVLTVFTDGGNARAFAIGRRSMKPIDKIMGKIVGKHSQIHSDEGTEFNGLKKIVYFEPATHLIAPPLEVEFKKAWKHVGVPIIINHKEMGELRNVPVIARTKYDRFLYNHSAGEHGEGGAESLNKEVNKRLDVHSNNLKQEHLQAFLNASIFHMNTKYLTTCQKFMLALMNSCRHEKPVFETKKRPKSEFVKRVMMQHDEAQKLKVA